MALSSVILVAERTSRNSYRTTLEKGRSGKSAFRFLDSVEGKRKENAKKKGFVDVVEDDQMGAPKIVRLEEEEEEEEKEEEESL